MIEIDVEKVADIIRHVARTEVMPRWKNLQEDEVRQKNPGDFVTIADEESERVLSQLLRDLLPGSLVVGEEAVSKNKDVLKILDGDTPVWVVDPIDGTYNFAHGRSKFGILVALVQNNETLYGWVYDVPGERMAIAVKGKGAAINGVPTRVRAAPETPAEMSGMGGGAQAWHFDPVRPLLKDIQNVRSSLHDFLNLAAGDADFVIHVGSVTPWDHSATILLAEEAGAYVRFAGKETRFAPSMLGPSMLMAATDENRWKKLEGVFYPALQRSDKA